jgi:hypothetical protein
LINAKLIIGRERKGKKKKKRERKDYENISAILAAACHILTAMRLERKRPNCV